MPPNKQQMMGGRPPLGRYKTDIDQEFYDKISNGQVPGYVRFGFAGHNPAAQLGIEETIWFPGGRRILLTTAKTLYISSTDDDDNATLAITALDAVKGFTTRIATLEGQSQVEVGGGTLIRVLIHATIGAGDANGTIYIAEKDTEISGGVPTASKIQSVSAPGRRLSWNGFTTVPAGKTMKLTRIRITPVKDRVANIYFNNKLETDGDWASATPFESGQNFDFLPFSAVDEKTDLEFSVISEDNQTKSTCVVDMILVDNAVL
jgi:hypothetical protein